MFRTVRVDDPDLVQDLEKKHVKFTGVRAGFLSQILWYWILPIALMLLLWRFLFQPMRGVGQSVLRFGQSGAKLVADTDIKVTFSDVAGCEEAKYELQEVVMFLKAARALSISRCENPQRRFACRPSWHGQDTPGTSGRRRSEGSVLFD